MIESERAERRGDYILAGPVEPGHLRWQFPCIVSSCNLAARVVIPGVGIYLIFPRLLIVLCKTGFLIWLRKASQRSDARLKGVTVAAPL